MEARAGWLVVMAVMVVGIMIGSGGEVEGAVDCNKVTANIAGCLGYVKLKGAAPTRSSVCCQGVRAIDATATTRPLRQGICSCLQTAAASIKPDPAAVAKLPSLCGATHPFSLSQNCAQVP